MTGLWANRAECLEATLDASRRFAELGMTDEQLNALRTVAHMVARRQDEALWASTVEKARALVTPRTPARLRAAVHASESMGHVMWERHRENVRAVEAQRAAYVEEQHEPGIWIAESNIGNALVDLGEYDRAIEHLERVIANLKRLQLWGALGIAIAWLGKAWVGKGDARRALERFREAMPLLRRFDFALAVLRDLVILHGRHGDLARFQEEGRALTEDAAVALALA